MQINITNEKKKTLKIKKRNKRTKVKICQKLR